jgi:hypothetical protein
VTVPADQIWTLSTLDDGQVIINQINHCYNVCTLINLCYTVCTLISHCYTVCTLINHCYNVCTLINHCYDVCTLINHCMCLFCYPTLNDGQQKGTATIPADKAFSTLLPYHEDFNGYAEDTLPKYRHAHTVAAYFCSYTTIHGVPYTRSYTVYHTLAHTPCTIHSLIHRVPHARSCTVYHTLAHTPCTIHPLVTPHLLHLTHS